LVERLEPAVIGELLGLLAHDLRNPLSALHSNLGFLKTVLTSTDRDVLGAVDDSVVSCEGLAHIIDNIDLIGRSFRDGTDDRVGAGAEVVSLIGDVVSASAEMAQSHGVRVDVEPLPAGKSLSRGTREPLERALANLVRNSVQHSPPNGTVKVSGRCVPDVFIVTVADRGTRLPADIGDDAFTAVGQVQAKSIPNGRYSRGLGLYCAGLAALAGRASVRSVEPPEGMNNAFELAIELERVLPDP
jgi:signal transduction histidine kinase